MPFIQLFEEMTGKGFTLFCHCGGWRNSLLFKAACGAEGHFDTPVGRQCSACLPFPNKPQGKVRAYEKGYNLHGNRRKPGHLRDRALAILLYSNTNHYKAEID
jgi:hypothetical protein